jgi:hypothetical protein
MTDAFVPLRHTALLAPYEKPGSAYTGPLCMDGDIGAGHTAARNRARGDFATLPHERNLWQAL